MLQEELFSPNYKHLMKFKGSICHGKEKGEGSFYQQRFQLGSDHTIDYIMYINILLRLSMWRYFTYLYFYLEITLNSKPDRNKECSPIANKLIAGCNNFKTNCNYRATTLCFLPHLVLKEDLRKKYNGKDCQTLC